MSLGSGPMSRTKWRPLEQLGWALGIVAGSVVLLCIWGFAIVHHLASMVVSAPPNADRQNVP